jgi:hypothetical protein
MQRIFNIYLSQFSKFHSLVCCLFAECNSSIDEYLYRTDTNGRQVVSITVTNKLSYVFRYDIVVHSMQAVHVILIAGV